MTADVHLVTDQPGARAVSTLLATVWPGGVAPIDPELAWVLARWGNYVAVAAIEGRVVGASVGLRAVDDDGPHLHSHVTGVLPDHRGAQVGLALKHHQRNWTLATGLDRITWTFDPLVTRNAYFNVMKLGVQVSAYLVDFYGPMIDGVNDGDESDRCLASWQLTSSLPLPGPAEHAQLVLEVGADGGPTPRQSADGAFRVRLPRDIVSLRRADPGLARRWRLALRDVLQPAYARGRRIVRVDRDGGYLVR